MMGVIVINTEALVREKQFLAPGRAGKFLHGCGYGGRIETQAMQQGHDRESIRAILPAAKSNGERAEASAPGPTLEVCAGRSRLQRREPIRCQRMKPEGEGAWMPGVDFSEAKIVGAKDHI